MRPFERADQPRLIECAVASGLFPPEAAPFLHERTERWLTGVDAGTWAVDDEDGRAVGFVFYEPRPATDRVWSLTMLVVDPTRHGAGIGRRMVGAVEDTLRASGQRLVVIETSGTAMYARTRAFYETCGYRRVAEVDDYFEDGDPMVLYAKRLTPRDLASTAAPLA